MHLWAESSARRDLGGGSSARSSINWSTYQLSRFLREPLIDELLDLDGSEHAGAHPSLMG